MKNNDEIVLNLTAKKQSTPDISLFDGTKIKIKNPKGALIKALYKPLENAGYTVTVLNLKN